MNGKSVWCSTIGAWKPGICKTVVYQCWYSHCLQHNNLLVFRANINFFWTCLSWLVSQVGYRFACPSARHSQGLQRFHVHSVFYIVEAVANAKSTWKFPPPGIFYSDLSNILIFIWMCPSDRICLLCRDLICKCDFASHLIQPLWFFTLVDFCGVASGCCVQQVCRSCGVSCVGVYGSV